MSSEALRCDTAAPLYRNPTSARLPEAVVLRIFSLLSRDAQAWSARLVCKSAHAVFGSRNKINASSKDLPLWVLQQMYRHTHQPKAEDSNSSKPPSQLQRSPVRNPVLGSTQVIQLFDGDRQLPQAQNVGDPSTQQQDIRLLASRAAVGDIPAVEWLAGQGCLASDGSVCTAAAGAGQLRMLRFLRQQQPPCPWDATACTAAAGAGRAEMLQWMLFEAEPHCECDVWTTRAAARSGQLAILDWLQERRLLQWMCGQLKQ